MPTYFDEDPAPDFTDAFDSEPVGDEPDPYQEINERRARVENAEALRNVRSL